MGSLLDDRPHRRFAMQEPEEKKPEKKVFLFTNPAFFCQRDRDMKPKQKLSERIIGEVQQRDAHLFVLYTTEDVWMLERLQQISELKLFLMDMSDPIASAKTLKTWLIKLGVQFRSGHPRSLTWLSMDKFAVNDLLVCVTKDDYSKLGIEPDKEITFQDQVAKRRRDAWP